MPNRNLNRTDLIACQFSVTRAACCIHLLLVLFVRRLCALPRYPLCYVSLLINRLIFRLRKLPRSIDGVLIILSSLFYLRFLSPNIIREGTPLFISCDHAISKYIAYLRVKLVFMTLIDGPTYTSLFLVFSL